MTASPPAAVVSMVPPSPPAPRRRWSWGRAAGACLLLLPVLLVLALAGLSGTEAGTRWLVARLLAASGDPVEISGLEGRLISQLSATSVKVKEVPGLVLHAVRLNWQPSALLGGELRLLAVEVGSLRVPPAAPSAPAQPGMPPSDHTVRWPRLPLVVTIERLSLGPVRADPDGGGVGGWSAHNPADGSGGAAAVATAGPDTDPPAPGPTDRASGATAETTFIDALELAARLDGDGLRVTGLALRAGAHRLEGGFALRQVAGPPQVEARLIWRGPHGLPPVAAPAAPFDPSGEAILEAAGALDDLDLRVALGSPVVARIHGRVRGLPGSPALELAGAIDDPGPLAAMVPLAVTAWPGFRLTGSLVDGFRLALDLTAGPADGRHPYVIALDLRSPPPPAGARLLMDAHTLVFDWHAEAAFEAPAPEATVPSPWPRRLAGHGRIEGAGADWTLAHHLTAPQGVTLTARFRRSAAGSAAAHLEASADLDLRAQALPVEWQGEALHLERFTGRLTAEGALTGLHVGLDGDGLLAPIGPVEIALAATVTPAEVGITTLAVSALSGRLDAEGHLRLPSGTAPAHIGLAFTAEGLDLEALFPGVPSRLGALGRMDLSLDPAGTRGEVRLERLAGRWLGAPLEARGRIHLEPGRQTVEDLRAVLGGNRLEGQVVVTPARLGGAVTLDCPRLARLHPALAGSLTGSLKLGGTPAAPAAQGQLRARALRFAGRGAERIDATVAVDPVGESRIALTAAGVTADAGVPIEHLAVVASGRAAAHRFELTATGSGLGLDVDFRGRWQAPRWRGLLQRLDIDHPLAGRWRSKADSEWSWDGSQVQGDTLCLESGETALCLRGARFDTHGGGAVEARLDHFDLARLHAALPEGVPLVEGILALAADVRLRPGALPDIEFDLKGDGVRVPLAAHDPSPRAEDLVTRGEGGRAVPGPAVAGVRATALHADGRDGGPPTDVLTLARLGARGALRGGRLTLDAEAAGDHGLEVSVVGLSLPLAGGAELGGRVTLFLGELAGLMARVPAIGEASGRFRIDATLGGSMAAPRLDSRFTLADGSLTLPALGLRLSVLDGTLSSLTAGVVDLRARLGTTDATLALTGRADLRGEAPSWWVELDGSAFPLVRRPELTLDVSPDLRLGGRGEALDLTGTLAVPTLRLAPFRPPAAAVAPSEDAVYVDGASAAEPVKPATLPPFLQRMKMDLELLPGDAVRISGWGLDTRITGDLRVRKERGPGAPRGQGELELIDGRFEAYGQKLSVEQGRILFAGPVDDPRLALRAIRPGIPVRAGVEVTGPLRSPDIRLFSEPAQSDADTLAYIVIGRPLAAASAADADALRTAALRMGVGRAALVTAPIARAFGLDTLDVATGATLDDTRIQLGKSLSPRLSLRSGFNPFDQLWSFIVNYRLSDRWALEAQTGAANSAADLIYSVETDDPGEIRDLWR